MRNLRHRQVLIETCLRMQGSALVAGTSGNVSVRVEDGFLITPTGMDYDALRPSDIVWMSVTDGCIRGTRVPSSEWRFHHDLYCARSDVGGIVHAHPLYCTALACQGLSIPAFHYMVAVAGGSDVRCADYATFGTQTLSDNVLAAMLGRRACLLANHGMLAVGDDLPRALKLAVEVETLAAQYWHVRQIGEPKLLGECEMRAVVERFSTYGQQPDSSG